MSAYARTRPRGLAHWQPTAKSTALVRQVGEILTEYSDFLPVTIRQVFYRLVGAHGYEKSERAYERLCEKLNRARRAGLIPFEAIRDDGGTVSEPFEFDGLPHLWELWQAEARAYQRVRLAGQPRVLELWVEAAGMVPQLAPVTHRYGVSVYSSGGFDSLTVKHQAAQRMIRRDVPTLVLHVGDHDPSGLSVLDSARDDVTAFVRDLDGPAAPEFRRVAVTEDQIARYRLPEAPAKTTDRRGRWQGGTVQAEALTPADLATEVRRSIEQEVDPEIFAQVLALEAREREEASRMVSHL